MRISTLFVLFLFCTYDAIAAPPKEVPLKDVIAHLKAYESCLIAATQHFSELGAEPRDAVDAAPSKCLEQRDKVSVDFVTSYTKDGENVVDALDSADKQIEKHEASFRSELLAAAIETRASK